MLVGFVRVAPGPGLSLKQGLQGTSLELGISSFSDVKRLLGNLKCTRRFETQPSKAMPEPFI